MQNQPQILLYMKGELAKKYLRELNKHISIGRGIVQGRGRDRLGGGMSKSKG